MEESEIHHIMDELSKNTVASLQMSSIDLQRTEWIEQFGDDFVIIHNPHFKYRNHEPYKLGQVLAIICEGGSAEGSVNLKPYRMEKNNFLVVLSSHIMESYRVDEDFRGYYILMSDSFLSRLDIGDSYSFYESVDKDPLMQFDDRTASAIKSYVDMARAICQMRDSNPNTGEALRLLTKLFFLMMGWFIHTPAIAKETKALHSDVMNNFLAMVKNHYREHRNVVYYADKMNMSAKYMSTLVKKASGKTALQWIEEYVILDAKAQLSSTINSVQQITYGLNFPNQSFFGRYFKRAVGMSPTEYRRSVRMSQAK